MCRTFGDAQDEMLRGLGALEGLRDLLIEAGFGRRRQFEQVTPEGLADLVGLVCGSLQRASEMFDAARSAPMGS